MAAVSGFWTPPVGMGVELRAALLDIIVICNGIPGDWLMAVSHLLFRFPTRNTKVIIIPFLAADLALVDPVLLAEPKRQRRAGTNRAGDQSFGALLRQGYLDHHCHQGMMLLVRELTW